MNIKEFSCTVEKIKEYKDDEGGIAKILILKHNEDFEFKAGQFIMLAPPGFMDRNKPDQLRFAAYSMCSSPKEKNIIELCLRIEKPGGLSDYVNKNVKVGSELIVKGPYGRFNLAEEEVKEYIFSATGTGIAPFISMLRLLKEGNFSKPVHLFFGFRNSKQFLYGEELNALEKSWPNFHFYPCCGDKNDSDWQGEKGFIQHIIKKTKFEAGNEAHCYACGIPAAVEETSELFKELGFKPEKIHVEKY